MADRIKGITIEIGGDTTKLQNALKNVNKEIKDTQSSLRDVDKLLKLDPGNTELLTQKQQMLGKAVEETKNKLQTLKTAQEQMKASGVDKSSAEYQALEREIIDCEHALKGLEKAARESNVTLQKVAVAGDKLKSVGSGIEAAGREVSKLSAVAATGLGAAINVTMNYEAEMSKVKALLGGTDEEFQAVSNTVRQLAQDTKYSASEVAQGAEYMALAGWEADEITQGLESTLKLAAASGEELATTSDIVTDVMTAYGISADKAGEFTDVLATAMSKSNTTVGMLGESFKYVGSVAGGMGYSIEDTALALGLMANQSVKGSQAGTSLRSIMSRMADPSKEVKTAMDALGISLSDDSGKMYTFYEVMQQIRSSFGELKISEDELYSSIATLDEELESGTITQKEYDQSLEGLMERAYGAEGAMKAQYASMLAGKNALAGYLAIINTSDEDFNKLADSIYNSKGATEEMYGTMTDNLQGELDTLKSKLEELGIQLGEIMLPYVKEIVDWIQQLVDKFNGLSDSQQEMIVKVGAVIAVLGPVLVIIGKIVFWVGQVMVFIPKIVGAVSTAAEVIGGVVAALGGMVVAAIALVIAAVVIWIKNWEEIKLAFKMAGEEIVWFFEDMWKAVKRGIDVMAQKFIEIKDKFLAGLDVLITNAKSKIDTFVNNFRQGLDVIKKILSGQLPFPKIKLPHFKVTGSFSLNPPKVPSFGIEWYKKAYDDAYLLNGATIFGQSNGKLLGGGEGNGSEAVVGTEKLMSMISEVVGNQSLTVVLEGDAAGVFNLVRTENGKFMKANGGYSPLVSG